MNLNNQVKWLSGTGLWISKVINCFALAVLLIISLTIQKTVAQRISLNDLSSFETSTDAWKIVGDVMVNPLVTQSYKTEPGSGILVGSVPSSSGTFQLKTAMTHGDVAVEFDVLLSHGASASIWLQGRYGLRLADSWKVKNLKFSDNGTLIPTETKGVASLGYLASMNTSRAPGIWQHCKIVFDAPRFDAQGNVIRNARMVSVEQNGMMIQENQYLPGPSQGALYSAEVAEGPLSFRVSKGHIAIRNIQVTKFTGQHVQLEDLTYRLYEDTFLDDTFIYWGGGEGDSIPLPDLSGRKPTKSGQSESINTRMTRGGGNEFALVFEGQIDIPSSGEYQFEIVPNGVGIFEVDGNELVRWNALHNKGKTDVTVNLQEGAHSFRQMYVNYGQPRAGLFVEGPGIKRQPLHEGGTIPDGSSVEPILLTSDGSPQIQRSFLFHNGQKLLTCMNVGSPEGSHYAVNLATGGLVQVWRGQFGDVTPMWHGRGEQQVLNPLGSVLSLTADQQIFLDGGKNYRSKENLQKGDYKRIGYTLNRKGEPIFEYKVGPISIRDHISPERKIPALRRSLQFSNLQGASGTVWFRLARAPDIEQVTNRLYAIDDQTYFLQVGDSITPEIKQNGKEQILLVPLQVETKPKTLTYTLIW